MRKKSASRPRGVIKLLLELSLAVIDFGLRLVLPDVPGRPPGRGGTSESSKAAQLRKPRSPIASVSSGQVAQPTEIALGPDNALAVADADTEEPPSQAIAGQLPDFLAHPCPLDDAELDTNGTVDDESPLTGVIRGGDESEPVNSGARVSGPAPAERRKNRDMDSVAEPSLVVALTESPPSQEPVAASASEADTSALLDPAVEPLRADGEEGKLYGVAETSSAPSLIPASPPPMKGTSIPPEFRGGAPRGPRAAAPNRPVTPTQERPQLICVRHGGAFHIGFEARRSSPSVGAASGELLPGDHGLRRVVDLLGGLTWQNTDAPPEDIVLPIALVFQLSADADHGWHVRRAGAGLNLLVAPREYDLLPAEGVTVVSRPATGIAGHHAWELQIEEQATAVSLRSTSGGIEVPVGCLEIVHDKGPVGVSDQGVLVFGPVPPRISLRDDLHARLNCLVIGREHAVGRRKLERIDPDEDLAERISDVLRNGGFGWYFIRVYGLDDRGAPTLESSTSFWYAAGLSSQANDASDPMPQNGTHEEIGIEVAHDGTIACVEARSVAAGSGALDGLEILRTGQGSLIRVPGTAVCDGVDIKIRSASGVTLTLRIPVTRYWWAVTDGPALPGEWGCARIDVPPRVFRADSSSYLHVRLPALSPPHALQVKFRDAPAHPLTWLRNVATTRFRLGDLDGDMRSLNTAACDLFLIAPDGLGDEDHVVALRMVPAFACRLCAAGYDSQPAAKAHIRGVHLDDLRPRITEYERIARAYNDQHPNEERLPPQVHKCTLCTTYYPVDEWQAKNSQSVRHMFSCPKLPGSEHTAAPFEIIKDINNIRASAAKHLVERAGDAFGCEWCPERVTFGKNEADEHIFSAHRKQLYDAH